MTSKDQQALGRHRKDLSAGALSLARIQTV